MSNDVVKQVILMTLENLEKKFSKNQKVLKIIQKYKDQINDNTFDYQDVLDKGWEFLSNIGIGENIQNLLEGDNDG